MMGVLSEYLGRGESLNCAATHTHARAHTHTHTRYTSLPTSWVRVDYLNYVVNGPCTGIYVKATESPFGECMCVCVCVCVCVKAT